MDPSLIPKVLATIEARGYGNAWAAYLGDKGDAPSMVDDFKGESCPAPSSITIMRSAAGAREALAALAAAAPGAAPPFATTGKRLRETAGTVASISGGAAAAPLSTGDGRLHVLAKRPRGRPRRIPAQPDATGDIVVSAAADMGEPKLIPGPRALRDRDLVARLASEYDSDEGGDADYEVESEEPSAPPLSAPQLPGSVGRGQHLPKGVTDVLVSWVIEHKKNPYPTNEEKETLKAQTGLGETQMRNYFTNLRKRHWTPMSTGAREPRNELECIFAAAFGHVGVAATKAVAAGGGAAGAAMADQDAEWEDEIE